MRYGTKDFWLAALRADGAAFRAAVSQDGVLGTPAPSCPGWTVADLTRHLGSTYQWVRGHAGGRRLERPEVRANTPAPNAPAGAGADVVEWFTEELALVDAFLTALDPDQPAWNWAPQAKTAEFWHRRIAHETAIHRWDAQLSTGLSEPIEAKLAADTVAEVLDTWLAAGRRKGPSGAHGMVRLTATDPGPEWYVRLRGEGLALLDTDTLLDDDQHPARAAAAGPASDLALALWGRIAFDLLDVAGDESLLEALRVG